jgi:hypothetical protein
LFYTGFLWSIWSNNGLRQIEAVAYSLGLFEAQVKLLVEMRVNFGQPASLEIAR